MASVASLRKQGTQESASVGPSDLCEECMRKIASRVVIATSLVIQDEWVSLQGCTGARKTRYTEKVTRTSSTGFPGEYDEDRYKLELSYGKEKRVFDYLTYHEVCKKAFQEVVDILNAMNSIVR